MYYYIKNLYLRAEGTLPYLTGHVVRADNTIEALAIMRRHGIGYPFNREVYRRKVEALRPTQISCHYTLLKRRSVGRGGKIFAEENGQLIEVTYEED